MRINTNVSAIQAYTNLGRVQNALQDVDGQAVVRPSYQQGGG